MPHFLFGRRRYAYRPRRGHTTRRFRAPRMVFRRSMRSGGLNYRRRYLASANRRTGGFIGREVKYVNTGFSGAITTTLATVLPASTPMNGITQGDAQTERIGNRVVITGIHVKGAIKVAGAISTNLELFKNGIRIIIGVDKQANKALPTAADILDVAGSLNSFRNLDVSARFNILLDKRMMTRCQGYASDGSAGEIMGAGNEYLWEFNKKCRIPTQYSGSTNGIGSISSNSIFMYAYMENTAPIVTMIHDTRCRFIG